MYPNNGKEMQRFRQMEMLRKLSGLQKKPMQVMPTSASHVVITIYHFNRLKSSFLKPLFWSWQCA